MKRLLFGLLALVMTVLFSLSTTKTCHSETILNDITLAGGSAHGAKTCTWPSGRYDSTTDNVTYLYQYIYPYNGNTYFATTGQYVSIVNDVVDYTAEYGNMTNYLVLYPKGTYDFVYGGQTYKDVHVVADYETQYSFNLSCEPNNMPEDVVVTITGYNTHMLINGTSPTIENGKEVFHLQPTCGTPFKIIPEATAGRLQDEIDSIYCSRLNGTWIESINVTRCTIHVATPTYSVRSDGMIGISGSAYSWRPFTWTVDLPGGKQVSGTTQTISINWDGRDSNGGALPPGEYFITAKAVTNDGKCSDIKKTPYNITCGTVESFTSSSQTINPYAGDKVAFNASRTLGNAGIPKWTLSIAGRTYSGSGQSFTAIWDGKYSNGRIAEPGTYTATLISEIGSGLCIEQKELAITVTAPPPTPPDEDCKETSLNKEIGSSVHLGSGALSQKQHLFHTKGAALPTSLSFFYNSLESSSGSLGLGWAHSYDITISENTNGSVLVREAGSKKVFELSGGTYVPPSGDDSILQKNIDGTFTITHKDRTVQNFDLSGRISNIKDRNDNIVSFKYLNGNLDSFVDPSSRKTSFIYDSDNRIISIMDPANKSYAISYVNGTIAAIAWPDGSQWRYGYDSENFMSSKTSPTGELTSYTYDNNHRVTQGVDATGATRSVSYPEESATPEKTSTLAENNGGIWSYNYDSQKGLLTQKKDPYGNITSYSYNDRRDLITETYPDGTSKHYSYDTAGNMLSMIDAAAHANYYTYNEFGQVTSIKDPLGKMTTNTYDQRGNLIETVDPLGAKTVYAYDSKGNVTSIVNPLNQTTALTYDAANNLISTRDPAGTTTSFTYDAMGNIITRIDAMGSTTSFEYDGGNRLIKTTDPHGNMTTYTYDLLGNKIAQTDANGLITRYEYNSQGKPVKIIDPAGKVTTYTYGATGCSTCGGTDKVTSITDANDNVTHYDYDLLGRLIKETDPKGAITTYTYNAVGKISTRTDANGYTTTYSYDPAGRVLSRHYPNGTEDTFTYDANGNILSAANASTSYTLVYDADQRLASIKDSLGRTVTYAYDAAGNRTKLTAPDGKITSYMYDANSRLARLTYGASIFTFTYDSLGRRTQITNPNGTYSTYSYDSLGNPASLTSKTSTSAIINSFTHTFDKIGNRLSMNEPNRIFSYGYDPLYRILDLTSSVAGKDEAFTYDPVGNRLTGPASATTYSYSLANQLTAKTGTTYQYDINGNLISKTEGTTAYTYSYDFENQLTKATAKTGTTTTTVNFKYDPFGRRIEKSTTSGKSTTIDKYLYDGDNVLYMYTGNSVNTRYVHNIGIDDPLALEQGSKLFSYHKDSLGTVRSITDGRGSVIQTYDYDSSGRIIAQKNTSFVQPYTYTGREWDKETGLYYYRARYYDPMEGRFVSRDPIGFKGGINLYSYVQNNPINFIDPYGLWRSPSDIYDEASKDAFTKFDPNKFPGSLHNGPGDAYRHCLASCMMAREDGNAVASLLGWANEKRGDWTHNQERGEREMDDYNNAKGRQCAKSSKSTQDCQQSCMSAVNNGDLKTYQSGSTPGYWK